MCMAHGVENRVPFLDHRVVEFAKGLATDMKVSAPLMRRRSHVTFHTKSLLKKVASDYYGEEFAYRQKSGFPLPMEEWVAGPEFANAFEEYHPAVRDLGMLDRRGIETLFEDAGRCGGAQAQMAWIVLALAAWWDVFIKGSGRRARVPSGVAVGDG
tara:strand:- start:844 stop:1311 length:468 start_codon:yes stop_codon:yes gene_type:complete